MITIKGQAGKALGGAEIDFSEIASAGSLSFRSLGVDEFRFTIQPSFLDARESNIPESGQEVTLFISGERVFVGLVSKVLDSWGTGELMIQIVVSGAWWWLEQTKLSDLITVGVERPQFRCELGSVEGHIQRLFSRLKVLGVPVELGQLDECYDIPTTTFRDASFGRALSELLRMVPDSVGWFDYSGSGLPKFRLSRRQDPAEAMSFTLGVDPIISGNLEAAYSLQISRVSVPYAERLPNGEISYKSLDAGPKQGTRQVLTVSGPELTDFVPPDPIEGIEVTTHDVGVFNLNIQHLWQFWADWQLRHPSVVSLSLVPWNDSGTQPHSFFNGIAPQVFLEDGTPLAPGDNQNAIGYVPNQTVPSWIDELYEVQRGSIVGTFYVYIADAPGDDPDYVTELIEEAAFVSTITGGANNGDRYLFFPVEVPVVLLPDALTAISVYKPLAYTFETPPSDLAANLQAAQEWLPYTGSVSMEMDTPRFTRRTGTTFNLAGGRKAWETMGALVQGETFDLKTQQQTLNIGLPSRLSGSTPVTRIQRSGSDSIVLL